MDRISIRSLCREKRYSFQRERITREDRAKERPRKRSLESRVTRESEVKSEVISVRRFQFTGFLASGTFPKPYQSGRLGFITTVRYLHVESRVFGISVADDDYRLTYR